MALKPLNSVGGFSVGEIPANVILGNADIISNNLTVQKVANLGPVGNVIITGGAANQYLQTDGAGNLTWTTADTSRILNGNSNVSIPSANGNVEVSVAGNSNIAVFTGTGANITGYFTVSGNLTSANANLGNLVTANFANFTNDVVVQGNIANANNISVTNALSANTGNFSGNITSLNANLGNLATANYVNVSQQINGNVGNFSGNVTASNTSAGNLLTANFANIASNTITNNLEVNLQLDGNTANFDGNVAALGVFTDNLYHANGSPWDFQQPAGANTEIQYNDGAGGFGASSKFTFDYAGNVLTVDGNANVTNTLIGNVANFSGNLTSANANLGNLAQANFVNVSTNVNVTGTMQAGNVRTDNLLYANGVPWDLQEAAGSNTEIQYNMGDDFAASANFTYNDTTQVFKVTGNANITNTVITPNVNSLTGNLTLTANGFNTVLDNSGNATFPGNVTAHTFYGNVNANITVTAANTSVLYSDAGLISGANGFTFDKASNTFSTPGDANVVGNLLVQGNANIANINITPNFITGDGTGIVLKDDTNGAQLEWNSNAYVYVDNTGASLEANGFIATLDFVGDFSLPNNLSVVGNIANANNISVTNALDANTGNFSGNITSLNANLGNLAQANYVNVANNLTTLDANVTGTLTVANANIASNLTVNNLTVNLELSGNTANLIGNVVLSGAEVTVNNHLAGNTANFSGNITALNANLGNIADANYLRTSEIYNGNSNVIITPNGNISLSATGAGNVVVVSNVGANIIGYVTANGDGTFGAVKSNSVTAQGGNLELYSFQSGDTYIQLRPFGNGTVDVGNTRITSLATPNAASDAATKQYVDDVAQGLNVHDSAYTATGNTLAILTGGTITYNNGTGGVGANLVLSGSPTANYLSANVFDGNTQTVVGSRILVKNEANAAHNGVYVVDSSTVLTRASDYNSVPEVEAGDFIFVQDGTQYNDTGWVQTSVVTTIGTDPINFTQFSGAGTYQAGAGLTLTGTVFSVNVDNITTEISGGNVIVKANAQFTTPNIGAATGTSVDLTGNVLAGNVNSNAKITAANLEVSSNIIAGNISANANLLVNNATVNLELSGNTANFSGNVVVPNLTVNTTLSGNVANFTGNLTAANGNLGNLLTANFANIASNTITSNLTVNLELAGNTANFSGNIVAGNISTAGSGGNITGANVVSANTFSGNLQATYANATGNITGGNLVTAGVANVAQLNVTGNVTSDLLPNANLTHDLGNTTLRWDNVYAGNLNASGNLTVGNISANTFSANTLVANTSIDIGNSAIYWGEVTTTSITANQAISTVPVSGITGIEWVVKGSDSAGSGKYSMAIVTAVTDGTSVDYSTFGGVNLGSTTGTLAVNVVGSNLQLQVTPSSSNSTVWVTQYRTI